MTTSNPFSLNGKTILVTGASSGIGRACAQLCAKCGARVIATGRDETRLAETFSALAGKHHLCVSADLTSREDQAKLLDTLAGENLSGVVHCAGISEFRPFSFTTEKNFANALATNTLAPLELTRQLLKREILGENSSIVFIASVAGTQLATNGQTAYALSKSALFGASKVMALELAPKKIRVNCICPAAVETPIHAKNGLTQEQLVADAEKYPLKRYGKPGEIAAAAVFLLSDASAWTTGTSLVIDGGLSLS